MLLENEQIVMHPMVIGELAMGNLANRQRTLEDFAKLPEISVATHEEVLFFIEHHRLMGTGISYVDANLLASVIAYGDTKIVVSRSAIKTRLQPCLISYTNPLALKS